MEPNSEPNSDFQMRNKLIHPRCKTAFYAPPHDIEYFLKLWKKNKTAIIHHQ